MVSPRFDEVEAELMALSELRGTASGTIRITAIEHSIDTILWPKLKEFLPKYPDIKVELIIDYGMVDIVAERYDAGVRLGGEIAGDMIAARIGPDQRMIVVGTPIYFAQRSIPKKPQDLVNHNCINLQFQAHKELYAWEFEKAGQVLKVHVKGQLVFNRATQMLDAALAGFGLAYIPEDIAHSYIVAGKLKQVLGDWCPYYSGYHLYYPHRHHASRAFTLLIEALRYQA